MPTRVLTYLLFFVSLFSASAQNYSFQQFDVGDGLPVNQVKTLYSDARGVLWIGTHGGGICQYNGARFSYPFSGNDGGWFIHAIDEDQTGTIWFASEKGIFQYDGSTLSRFVASEDSVEIQDILCTGDYLLWVSNHGVYQARIKPEPGRHAKISSHQGGKALLIDRDSMAVIVTSENMFSYREGAMMHTQQLPMPHAPGAGIESDNAIWLGDAAGSLYQQRYGGFQEITDLPSGITAITNADFGQFWLGTQSNGLYLFDPITSHPPHHISAGKPGLNAITDLEIDILGQLWISTSNEGLFAYSVDRVENYGAIDPEHNVLITDLVQSGNERIFALTRDNVAGWIQDGVFKASEELDQIKVFSHWQGRDNTFLIGTSQGLYHLEDSTALFYPLKISACQTESITKIQRDGTGNFWVSTNSGRLIHLVLEGVFTHLTYRGRVVHSTDAIRDFHVDKRNRVWLATADSFFLIDQPVMEIQPVNSPVRKVRRIMEDKFGTLWILTERQGIWQKNLYDTNTEFTLLDLPPFINSQDLKYGILTDQVAILGSDTQLYKLQMDGPGNAWRAIHQFSPGDGFPGTQILAVFADPAGVGNIVVSTREGLFTIKNAQSMGGETIPSPYLKSVNLFYADLNATEYADKIGPSYASSGPLALKWDENHLGFTFDAVRSPGTTVLFQWVLEGSNADWSDLTSTREVYFSNLSSGSYRFRLKACTLSGKCSELKNGWSFTIPKPFWKTWWFRAVIVTMLGLFLYLAMQIRIRNLKRRAAIEKRQLTLEKERLELEQKALQLQMNPHFVSNAMITIQQQIRTDSLKEARRNLGKFTRLMRAMLNSARVQMIPLDEEIAFLEDYVAVQNLTRVYPVQFDVMTDPKTDPEETEIPPMLLQPLVENSFEHGIPRDRSGTIRLEIKKKGRSTLYILKDDGVGPGNDRNKDRTGVALQVIRERLALFSPPGRFRMMPRVSPGGEVAGTEVHLYIPNQLT